MKYFRLCLTYEGSSERPETDLRGKDEDSHPSIACKSTKILTRELVYNILLGTLRGSQKYH